jgi:hypothetical protein
MMQGVVELLEKEEFQPFRIITTSGVRYTVKHPHLVAVGEKKIFIFGKGDQFIFINNAQIASVESLPK